MQALIPPSGCKRKGSEAKIPGYKNGFHCCTRDCSNLQN